MRQGTEIEVRVSTARIVVRALAAVLGLGSVVTLAITFIRTGYAVLGVGFVATLLGTSLGMIMLAEDIDLWLRERGL